MYTSSLGNKLELLLCSWSSSQIAIFWCALAITVSRTSQLIQWLPLECIIAQIFIPRPSRHSGAVEINRGKRIGLIGFPVLALLFFGSAGQFVLPGRKDEMAVAGWLIVCVRRQPWWACRFWSIDAGWKWKVGRFGSGGGGGAYAKWISLLDEVDWTGRMCES